MPSADLQSALERTCAPDSIYWSFLDAEGLDRRAAHTVEVRLNLPGDRLADPAPIGWTVAHIDLELGAAFLRRKQPLTDEALKALFSEAVTLAAERGGQFHSWAHGGDLP